MKIYQCWDEEDPAESDSFFPTKKKLYEHLRSVYGLAPNQFKQDCTSWTATTESFSVNFRSLNVEPTGEGICIALKVYPNR